MSDEPKSYQYHLTYNIEAHPDGLTKEQILARGDKGGCDALFIASILYPPDGSYSVLFGGTDGRTGTELSDHEWFKLFILLSKRLSESTTLDEGKRYLAGTPFEMWRDLVVKPNMAHRCEEPHCTDHEKEAD